MIGPRIPRSWLHDVENEAEDDRLSFEGWFTPDLYLSAAAMGVNVDENTFCQVALSGVMLGDVGAVAVIQEAHTRLLLANGVLDPEELIGGSPFAWDGEVRGYVYIDDLVLVIVGELCDGPPPEIVRRLEAADTAYGSHDMPVTRDKSEDPALAAELWGATLHRGTGRKDTTWKDVRRWPRRRSLPWPSGSQGTSSGGCWASGPAASASGGKVCPPWESPTRPRNRCLGGGGSCSRDQRSTSSCRSPYSGRSSRRICGQTPPAIARADPSSSRRTRRVKEGLVRALELLSVNTDKGPSHSGRASTRSPRKR